MEYSHQALPVEPRRTAPAHKPYHKQLHAQPALHPPSSNGIQALLATPVGLSPLNPLQAEHQATETDGLNPTDHSAWV
jgi:hypothetical protein